ncbi:MAG: helix-turn-helix transcriptional regulator [Ruminococcaceae bacterium]|nr:helix-turn-helix transcriptional regulator [Oscillospiraceae bacterium]
MKNLFISQNLHTVTEADINYYAVPFLHPKRIMNEHDFIYVLDGEWKIGQNNEVFSLKKDSLLILAAGNSHYGVDHCLPKTKTMYFHISGLEGEGVISDSQNNDGVIIDTMIDASLNSNIKRLFFEIVNSKLLGNNRKASLYFELLLCELSEYNLKPDETDLAVKLKKIIHRNPEKFYSNNELAQLVGVSAKTCENKFKAAFSITMHQYMLEFKIKEAISYFEMFPQMSIKETAYNLGFYDEYHFSKQFKKIMGVSPTKYRNK